MCTLKVRVYDQGSTRFAIEFQRRCGDPFTFNETFEKAHAFLKKHLDITEAAPEPLTQFVSLLPPGIGTVYSSDDSDLMHILDMANSSNTEFLEAEAATVLSNMAAEGSINLCTTSVFQSIAKLLKTNSIQVAHPTSQLVWHLSQRAEAAPLFAANGLLLQLLEKVMVVSADVHDQVRNQLAKALDAAIHKQSKATLSESDAAALLSAFKTIHPGVASEDVTQLLETAQLALKALF